MDTHRETLGAGLQVSKLDGRAYVSQETFESERQNLLRRHWIVAGLLHELPPGGVVPSTVAGQPILIARDRDGTVRAFHNICRHRGTLLIDKPQADLRRIVCPYHAWCYELDGKLAATPNFMAIGDRGLPEGASRNLGLLPVRTAVWYDWVFVALGDEAPEFETAAAAMIERLAEYDLSLMRHSATYWWDIGANWKLVQENYLEAYHLPTCHPAYSEWSPADKYDRFQDNLFMGHFADNDALEIDAEGSLPVFPGAKRYQHLLFFPTFKMTIGPDSVATGVEFWDGPGKVRQRWDYYFVGNEAMSDLHRDRREWYEKDGYQTNAEHVAILERSQAGMASLAHPGSTLSPVWEPLIGHFQSLAADGAR